MRAGERIGRRFLLTEPLVPEDSGRRVWRALDEKMGRDVVLKDVGGTGRAPGYAPAEVRALARAGHPHVITVYEFVEIRDEGEPDGDWAVLEWASGGSLVDTTMSPAAAARTAGQIASALAHLHRHGIVHGDVKPGNIVRAADGAVKLTDFGSVYRTGTTVTPQPPLSYTPGYAPPEIVRQHRPVPRSDVYSLAATVHALVTGAPPARPPGDLSRAGSLAGVLAGMLAEDPADRPDAAAAVQLFQAVADGDGPVVVTDAPTIPPSATRAPVVPAQLPADVPGFAGRTAELGTLDSLAATAAGSPAVAISAVSGTAGVGKTTLAVHWAHRAADRFPDGQLYVNLRGFDPTGHAMTPAEAIRGFLDALGVPAERIPPDLAAQAGFYRSLVAGRHILVVLDNARDTQQVQPLLPGTPTCHVLITSRNHLIDLVAHHAASTLDLDVLTEADARALLDQRLGTARTTAEPDAVDNIIKSCARLPLALAIVAARAAIRPTFRLAAFATELHDSHTRLAALAGERPDTDIRAVFSWSSTQLTPAAQRLFRLLGLHPGPDISAAAAASLAGVPLGDAVPLLAELTRAHLITEHTLGRYTLHDLLRAYATELAHTFDSEPDRHAATERILDHYLHTAYAARRLLYPWLDTPTISPPRPGVVPEQPTDQCQATSWVTAEHLVLRRLLKGPRGAESSIDTWPLALAFDSFFSRRGYWHELTAVWQAVLDAAAQHDEYAVQARAYYLLAYADIRLGRLDEAHAHLEKANELSTMLGDRSRQSRIEKALATVCAQKNHYAEALQHNERALELSRETGDRDGEAGALGGVGWYLARLGRYESALRYCEQAVRLCQQVGNRTQEAETWDSIGYVHHHLGHFDIAVSHYRRALEMHRILGGRYDEADTLDHLGDTQHAAGDSNDARRSWQEALIIFDELNQPEAEAVRTKLERLVRSIDEDVDDNG